MAEVSFRGFSDSQSQDRKYVKEAAVSFLRRNVKLAYNSLNKRKDQSQEVKGARQLFDYSLEQGMKWLGSEDPTFFSAIEVFSKGAIEKSLTAFSATQTAKLLGKDFYIKHIILLYMIIRCLCVSSLS